MDLTRIDLNLLVAFEALFIERNVTKAARRLGISQPATSDALRRLRLLFGDELFVRSAGSMQPSPKAIELAASLDSPLVQLREALGDRVPFDPSVDAHDFTVAATDYNALILIPPLLLHMRTHAPKANLHVVGYDKDTVGARLARGEIDLALGVFADSPEQAVKASLFEERFVGVARRDHPAIAALPMDMKSFASLPHALVTVRSDRHGVIDRELARHGLQRRVVLTMPHMLVLPNILAASDLVCALPRRVAVKLDSAILTIFELPCAIPSWNVEMLWNPVARGDQANAWLRRAIQRLAKAV